jgi:hypothetical protein
LFVGLKLGTELKEYKHKAFAGTLRSLLFHLEQLGKAFLGDQPAVVDRSAAFRALRV